jgi:O-antigen/teichoic acid export membrane protein
VQALGYALAYYRTLSVYRPKEAFAAGTLRYGTHLSVMGGLGILAAQGDVILAFHYLGASGLAVYAVAVAIPERLGGLVKFIPSAALPKFSNRPFGEARAGLLRKLPLAIAGLLLIAGVYALIAPWIFSFLFPTYLDAVPYSQWYALAILGVLTQLLVMLLSAHAFVRRLYVFNIASPLLQLLLQAGGVIVFGLLGLVLGRLIGLALAFLLAFLLVMTATPASSR